MASERYPTCFLDLCAAGAPLAAIARFLHNPSSCRDQLQLGHAVGKGYRDVVLREIKALPALRLELAGCNNSDVRTFARFLLRLEGVESVQPRAQPRVACYGRRGMAYKPKGAYDAEGLMQLRLLPSLKQLARLDGALEGQRLKICESLATLTTLESLEVGPFAEEEEEGIEGVAAAAHLGHLTRLTRLAMPNFSNNFMEMDHIEGMVHLRELDLDGNLLILAEEDFAPLTSLTKLSASYSNMNEERLLCIAAATGLRELCLVDNYSIDAHCIQHLSSLKALTLLDIQHCGFEAEDMRALSCLRSLAVLNGAPYLPQ